MYPLETKYYCCILACYYYLHCSFISTEIRQLVSLLSIPHPRCFRVPHFLCSLKIPYNNASRLVGLFISLRFIKQLSFLSTVQQAHDHRLARSYHNRAQLNSCKVLPASICTAPMLITTSGLALIIYQSQCRRHYCRQPSLLQDDISLARRARNMIPSQILVVAWHRCLDQFLFTACEAKSYGPE